MTVDPAPPDRLLDSDCELTTYAELAAVLDALPMLMREARRHRRVSMRVAGDQIGISFSTVCRIEEGARDCALSSAVAVLHWLHQPAEDGDHA